MKGLRLSGSRKLTVQFANRMLHVIFSNRHEVLRHALCERLAASRPGDPFSADQVVVPSSAVRRDLQLHLAVREGVCANVEFAFLGGWMWELVAKAMPEYSRESPFERDRLSWRILQIIEAGELGGASRPEVWSQNADALSRFDLAQRIAALFENYLVYRPDWLDRWSHNQVVALEGAGPTARADEHWQARLWRKLVTDLKLAGRHPIMACLDLLRGAADDRIESFELPAAVHVFGLPAMPPLHIELLHGISHFVDVHLYALNPCEAYWFEIVEPRRLSLLTARGQRDYQEPGNSLLAAWGRQTQSHLSLLFDRAPAATLEEACFEAPAGDSLLAQVQKAILRCEELGPGMLRHAPGDRSIEIHDCHSLTRELEALQDRLLGLFAGDPTLSPQDILVVTPDLDAAAPLIEAVFGNVPRERHIPFAISGLAESEADAVTRAFFSVLDTAASRCAASAVFGLLQQPPVMERFGFAQADLDLAKQWIAEAGIRWGLDSGHLQRMGLMGAGCTFSDGMERLLLGYAMPDGHGEPWQGQLPAGGAEGSEAEVLGRLGAFFDALAVLSAEMASARRGAEWALLFAGVLSRFIAETGEMADSVATIRQAIARLEVDLRQAGFERPVEASVFSTALKRRLDATARGGIATGRVTFTSMSSLRGVPFRVVSGIGLDDGAFPAAARPDEFDLMTFDVRLGDRQRRHDDRNLFLDLLLAAREVLHLSYSGRSIRDNSVRPPSVLISELLDAIGSAAAGTEGTAGMTDVRRALVVQHPLQAFAASYFDPGSDIRLRSCNSEICEAIRKSILLAAEGATGVGSAGNKFADGGEDDVGAAMAQPFFSRPLPPPGLEWQRVEVSRLINFFANPSRFLLKERLGIALPQDTDHLADEEAFSVSPLQRMALGERLLAHPGHELHESGAVALAQAGQEFPRGAIGELLVSSELSFLARHRQWLGGAAADEPLPRHDFELSVTDPMGVAWTLCGRLSALRTSGQVLHRYDDVRARDRLNAWLHHLVLCAARPDGVALRTFHVGRDQVLALEPVADAKSRFAELLGLYGQGLVAPLPFFIKSAWAYVDSGGNLAKAAGKWKTGPFNPTGEDADDSHRLAFRGVPNVLDERFVECANTVFGPLKSCLGDAA